MSGTGDQTVLVAVFDGLNRYLGNYLGEFVGELCLNAFFFLSARAMWRDRLVSRWIAGVGLTAGILGWIGMWRNVTSLVAPAAALNNLVLPVWMVVFALAMLTTAKVVVTRAELCPTRV